MKNTTVTKILWASVSATMLAILPNITSVSAQTNTAPAAPGTTAPGDTTPNNTAPGTTDTPAAQSTIAPGTTEYNAQDQGVAGEDRNDGFDWGWLGLLGLAGLAGLTKKPEERTVYRDPDPTDRTATRY